MQIAQATAHRVEAAVAAIRKQHGYADTPRLGLVVEGPLMRLADAVSAEHIIEYGTLDGVRDSAVMHGKGHLRLGAIGQTPVACLAGYAAYFDGADEADIRLPIRLLKALGCEIVFFISQASSVDRDMEPGSVMLVADHLNLTGFDPLRGHHEEEIGPRHTSMNWAWDPDLRNWMRSIAYEEAIFLREGVLAGIGGPSLLSPSETRMVQGYGADATAMAMILEGIVALHAGLRMVGAVGIVDYSAGAGPDSSHDQEARQAAAERFSEALIRLLFGFCETLA